MKDLTSKIHKTYENFIYKRTYARFLYDKNRREDWTETVARYERFFSSSVPYSLRKDFDQAIDNILAKKVMPSMRALWSAGPALEENNLAAFNCAYVAMDNLSKFGEMLYVLMHGKYCCRG